MKRCHDVVLCCLIASALPAAAQTQQIQVQGRKVLVHVPAGYDPRTRRRSCWPSTAAAARTSWRTIRATACSARPIRGASSVSTLEARYAVDAGRVFATGMSNGGMLVYRLACEAADVFRAAASVAGPDATTRRTPARPVSVLHIHAHDDDHVLFDGGAGPGAFRDRHSVMDFVSVPQTIARWVQRDQCGVVTADWLLSLLSVTMP